jgi:hypothetical protein
MKQKLIELVIALPCILVLGYEGGKFMVNILLICVLPFLGRYLWANNPFRDSFSSSSN